MHSFLSHLFEFEQLNQCSCSRSSVEPLFFGYVGIGCNRLQPSDVCSLVCLGGEL